MSEYRAKVTWTRNTEDFEYATYDRTHQVEFGGGIRIAGSAAPSYKGLADKANPEEMLAASLSGCHMLSFLALAANSHATVDSYTDEAVATLAKNAQGRLAITRVVLRPKVKMSPPLAPDRFQLLHEKAHHVCFIANSVLCEVVVEAVQE